MNILIVADKSYLKYSVVLLQSIFFNHPNEKIDLYVATSYGESKEYHILKSFILDNRGAIHLCPIPSDEYSKFPLSSILTKECYYILNISEYLPNDITRILYLDADIIVHKNISEFYYMDFDESPIIVCPHKPNFIKPSVFNTSKLKEGRYFNSGVILFNMDLIRKFYKSYDFSTLNYSDFSFDQGVLNYMFAETAKYIETMIYNYRFSIRMEHYEDAKYFIDNDLMKIYHYTNAGVSYKPWDLYFDDNTTLPPIETFYSRKLGFFMNNDLNLHYGIWWQYAFKTPIKELLYYEMSIKRDYIMKYNLIERWNQRFLK